MKKPILAMLASLIFAFPSDASESVAATSDLSPVNVCAEGNSNGVASLMKTDSQPDYIEIDVETPGTLADLLLQKVETLTQIEYLRIRGTLNEEDWNHFELIKRNIKELDLSGLTNTTMPVSFGDSDIVKIWLPSSLKELNPSCFFTSSCLTYVSLPESLETIGNYCFKDCSNLTNIEFPQSLKTIEYNAFSNVPLKEINLPEGLVELSNYVFCDNNAVEHIEIPDGIKVIRNNCFYCCRNLKSITFGKGLEEIGEDAFSVCAVDSLEFPASLRSIGVDAFTGCQSLVYVKLNEGLNEISSGAFENCKALKEVELPSTVVSAIASFDYCENLKKITCKSIAPPLMNAPIKFNTGMEERELIVPEFSIKNYKLDNCWGVFEKITTIDIYPERISVLGEMELTISDMIPTDYNPAFDLIHKRTNSNTIYGQLTIDGDSQLHMSSFSTYWDLYERRRLYFSSGFHDCYALLMNDAQITSEETSVICNLYANQWNFISFPFDVKVGDIESLDGVNHWVIRGYSGVNRANGNMDETWVKMEPDSVLRAGQGYIICGYRSGSYGSYFRFKIKSIDNERKNNIFVSNDVELELNDYPAEFSHNRGWNFIGNPYPTYFDSRFIGVDAPITVMDEYGYKAYSLIDDSYILTPGEPFFVQCPEENNRIVFNKEGRQFDLDVRDMGAMSRSFSKRAGAERTLVNLIVAGRSQSDETRVVINEDASKVYESHCDAVKFMPEEDGVLQVYSCESGVNYAINERPLSDGCVNLCMDVPEDGTYHISLREAVSGYDVTLVDNYTGNSVKLNDSDSYEFNSVKANLQDRFVLIIEKSGVTGVDDLSVGECRNDEVYTITGQKAQMPLEKGIYIKNGKKVIIK